MTATIKGNVAFNTSKAQNVAFFASNLLPSTGLVGPNTPVKFRVTIAFTTASGVLALTVDGTNFFSYNQGTALTQNAVYIFDVMIRSGDTFNMEATNAAGATIGICRVDEIIDEG